MPACSKSLLQATKDKELSLIGGLLALWKVSLPFVLHHIFKYVKRLCCKTVTAPLGSVHSLLILTWHRWLLVGALYTGSRIAFKSLCRTCCLWCVLSCRQLVKGATERKLTICELEGPFSPDRFHSWLFFFLVLWTKYLIKEIEGGGDLFWLTVWRDSLSQPQEHAATGHIAVTVRAHTSLHVVWDPCPWNSTTYICNGSSCLNPAL